MIGRSQAGRVLRALGLRPRPAPPWITTDEQPDRPRPLDSFRFFAIVCAWMEGDVIGATVANAFAQGCERVYLVDNDSPDDTVRAAVDAGAVLAESFSTERFEERLRFDIMNRVVRDVSEADGSEHIWWLWLDADEFPHGPRGMTIREHLAPLDRRFRVVGARFMNHFPSGTPQYLTGFHPLEFQPLCEEHHQGRCGHRKHPLQRYDRAGPSIECGLGIHQAHSATRPLIEPPDPIFHHHFPYRDESVTRKRLARLCGTDENGRTRVHDGDTAVDGMVPRFETLDAVYRGHWDQVRSYRGTSEYESARPVPWATLAPRQDVEPRRWYSTEALDEAARAALDSSVEQP